MVWGNWKNEYKSCIFPPIQYSPSLLLAFGLYQLPKKETVTLAEACLGLTAAGREIKAPAYLVWEKKKEKNVSVLCEIKHWQSL